MNSDNKLKVVLLRHGESVYNVEKRLPGQRDFLTLKGKLQIESLKEDLLKFNFNKIISSDERRAVESAEIISRWYKKSFKMLPLIREKSSGEFSDKLVDEVDWSLVKGSFLEKKILGGENVSDVIIRTICFFRKLNESKQGETVLVVSHGTFLRILLSIVFNKSIQEYLLNYEFPNACYMIISRDNEGRWNLEKSCLIQKGEVPDG